MNIIKRTLQDKISERIEPNKAIWRKTCRQDSPYARTPENVQWQINVAEW